MIVHTLKMCTDDAGPEQRFFQENLIWLHVNTVNSEIFTRILFSRTALTRHICQVKNSRLWHDLPTSVKDKEFLPFRKGFIFREIRGVSRK